MTRDTEAPDLSSDGWQKRYESGQTGWDRGGPNPAIIKWLESGLLQPGRILIPGCGRGHEVIELAKRGFKVTAVDFAQSAVEILTTRLQEHRLVGEVVRESVLNFKSEIPFDSIYEQTCLCAINPNDWIAYEQRLHSNLKLHGTLFVMFMQTDAPGGPPFHCELSEMKRLFPAERWSWSDEEFSVDHPSGMKELARVLKKVG